MMFVMMAMATAHIIMKVLACALILRLNQLWLWLYLGVDMALFLVIKTLRRDLRFWFDLNEVLSWIVTLPYRIVTKIITDFTMMIHERRKYFEFEESGGKADTVSVFS